MRATLVLCLSLSASIVFAAPSRLPLEALPERYELTLAPHVASGTFDGSGRIKLRVPRPTATVTLNAVDLDISRAAVGDAVAAVRVDAAAQQVTLTFPQPLPAGTALLTLAWRGKLSSDLGGFYRAEADGRRYAFTDFEPTEARRAFPCFDEPAVKTRYVMKAVIDAGDIALSNSAIVRTTLDRAHGLATIEFAETPPLSTYLVALAVGPLVSIEAMADRVPVRVFRTPGKAKLGRYALTEAQKLLPWLEQYFGIPYPYGKLDLVGVPDFEAGAMENAGAIFFRETSLLAAEQASVEQQRKVTLTVAHEMAHQWFGDLVTMKWWDDLWLNESFATWAENRVAAAVHPAWEGWLDFQEHREDALGKDALAVTHPIRAPVAGPDDAHAAFDSVTYSKGATVLHMLERWLGEDNFRRGVSDYLRAHREGNATADDLWRALSAASGRPVADVARSWIDRPGHPLVTATASCVQGKTELQLSQERDGRLAAATPPWPIPLCTRTPDGARCGLMTETRERRVVADRCVPWVLANVDSAGFFRVRYGGDGVQALGRVMATELTANERAGLLADTWALVHDGRLPLTDYLQLVEDDRHEPRAIVVKQMREPLLEIGAELIADSDRAAWQRYLSELFAPTVQSLGWEARANDSDDQRRLRGELLEILSAAEVPSVLSAASARMERALGGGGSAAPLDASLLGPTAAAAAHVGDEARWQAYLARMRATSNPDERDRFLKAMSHFTSPALLERSLSLALTPDVRTQDVAHLVRDALEHPWSRRAAWRFTQAHFAELRARVPEDLFRRVLGAVDHFCDAEMVTQAQRFWAPVKLAGGERRLAQALEDAQACVDLKQREHARLSTWLRARTHHAALVPRR
jgi:aminopeptidase N